RPDFDLTKPHHKDPPQRHGGQYHYSLLSYNSGYGLGMVNTLGNFNHHGVLAGPDRCGRTTVYTWDLVRDLLPLTSDRRLVVCFTSDGVKDVLSASEIGSAFSDIEGALVKVWSSVVIGAVRRAGGAGGPSFERKLCEQAEFVPIEDLVDVAASGLSIPSVRGKTYSKTSTSSENLDDKDEDRAVARVMAAVLSNTSSSGSFVGGGIRRRQMDAFDRKAKNDLCEQIVEMAERDLSSDVDVPPPPPLDVACAAVVDLAVLRYSHDDVTVLAVEIGEGDFSRKERGRCGDQETRVDGESATVSSARSVKDDETMVSGDMSKRTESEASASDSMQTEGQTVPETPAAPQGLGTSPIRTPRRRYRSRSNSTDTDETSRNTTSSTTGTTLNWSDIKRERAPNLDVLVTSSESRALPILALEGEDEVVGEEEFVPLESPEKDVTLSMGDQVTNEDGNGVSPPDAENVDRMQVVASEHQDVGGSQDAVVQKEKGGNATVGQDAHNGADMMHMDVVEGTTSPSTEPSLRPSPPLVTGDEGLSSDRSNGAHVHPTPDGVENQSGSMTTMTRPTNTTSGLATVEATTSTILTLRVESDERMSLTTSGSAPPPASLPGASGPITVPTLAIPDSAPTSAGDPNHGEEDSWLGDTLGRQESINLVDDIDAMVRERGVMQGAQQPGETAGAGNDSENEGAADEINKSALKANVTGSEGSPSRGLRENSFSGFEGWVNTVAVEYSLGESQSPWRRRSASVGFDWGMSDLMAEVGASQNEGVGSVEFEPRRTENAREREQEEKEKEVDDRNHFAATVDTVKVPDSGDITVQPSSIVLSKDGRTEEDERESKSNDKIEDDKHAGASSSSADVPASEPPRPVPAVTAMDAGTEMDEGDTSMDSSASLVAYPNEGTDERLQGDMDFDATVATALLPFTLASDDHLSGDVDHDVGGDAHGGEGQDSRVATPRDDSPVKSISEEETKKSEAKEDEGESIADHEHEVGNEELQVEAVDDGGYQDGEEDIPGHASSQSFLIFPVSSFADVSTGRTDSDADENGGESCEGVETRLLDGDVKEDVNALDGKEGSPRSRDLVEGQSNEPLKAPKGYDHAGKGTEDALAPAVANDVVDDEATQLADDLHLDFNANNSSNVMMETTKTTHNSDASAVESMDLGASVHAAAPAAEDAGQNESTADEEVVAGMKRKRVWFEGMSEGRDRDAKICHREGEDDEAKEEAGDKDVENEVVESVLLSPAGGDIAPKGNEVDNEATALDAAHAFYTQSPGGD
ncbi:hypothetical protein HK102_001274, partial [Quaeritorhiza haematococci]